MMVGEPRREGVERVGSSRQMVYVVAAGVLAVAVIVAVLVFGVVRPPGLDTVTDNPTPSPERGVAWFAWSGSSNCVRIAMPDGDTLEPWCGESGGELVGWDTEDDSLLLSRYDDSGMLHIDVDTGETRRVANDGGTPSPRRFDDRGETLASYRDGGQLVVEHGDTELWRVDAPEAYRVDRGWESPDGSWIASTDSADRILLFATDGGAPPRVWVDRAQGATMLVWEGEVPGESGD